MRGPDRDSPADRNANPIALFIEPIERIGLTYFVTGPPPEYVIIRKLEYRREGGSDKDQTSMCAMFVPCSPARLSMKNF